MVMRVLILVHLLPDFETELKKNNFHWILRVNWCGIFNKYVAYVQALAPYITLKKIREKNCFKRFWLV